MSTHPPSPTRDNPGRSTPEDVARSGAPASLGEFEIRREIGRGGMGTVYEAYQRSLHRIVALKILDRQIAASRAAVTRFQREAQAAARLQHPHIVAVYAQGEEQGTHYYAMEYVDGESLHALIGRIRAGTTSDQVRLDADETVAMTRSANSNPLAETVSLKEPRASFEESDTSVSLSPNVPSVISTGEAHVRYVAEQMATVANALDYAHENGIIHRDIKPHNLLMGRDGRLRISDFGLARLAQQPGVTMTGEVIGSPLYMSPEQILGGTTDVDRRTDIYSLGATLYEWLTLFAPYPGETREQVIGMILKAEPKRPRVLNTSVPLDLETICLKAIANDRHRRYQTAAELRDDLRRFLEKRPIHARRAGIAARTARWIVRHPARSIGVSAALVAVLLGWSLYSKQNVVRSQGQAIVAAQERVEKAARQAAATTEALRSLGWLERMPIEFTLTSKAVEVAKGVVEKNPLNLNVPGLAGRGDQEVAAIGSPSSIARRVAVQYYKATLPADGFTPTFSGDEARSEYFREALRVWSAEGAAAAIHSVNGYLRARPNDLDALRLRLALYAELRRFEEMDVDAEKLVTLHSQSPDGYFWRGAVNLLLDRIDKGVIATHWVTQLDDSSAWAKVLYGLALIRAGRPPGAKEQFAEAMRLSPGMTTAALGMASAHVALNEGAAAIAVIRRVLEFEPRDPDALCLRGDANMSMRSYEAAAQDYQRAIDIAGSTPSLSLRFLAATVQQQVEESNTAETVVPEPRRENPSPMKDAESVIDWFSRLIQPRPKGESAGKNSPGSTVPAIPKTTRPGN